jgi:hypothetical protein
MPTLKNTRSRRAGGAEGGHQTKLKPLSEGRWQAKNQWWRENSGRWAEFIRCRVEQLGDCVFRREAWRLSDWFALNAAEVVHGARGTVVHTNYNWNDPYWHSHKYGYWNGKRGYWHVVNGNHVFVVVN